MRTTPKIPPNPMPRRQRGLLGLAAALAMALLMSLGVLVVDLERLSLVRTELQRGMAACEAEAPRELTAAGDAASAARITPLQRAALDLGVALGCHVRKQLAAPGSPVAVPSPAATGPALPPLRLASPRPTL